MAVFFRVILVAFAMFGLAACFHLPNAGKHPAYRGESVTAIEVHKADRKMFLLHGSKVLKTYNIQLGGSPVGPKQFEGDKKTPEGAYRISEHNPKSTYHLSLRISYPNDAQRAYAKKAGKQPGGDIFIHGQPGWTTVKGDWTMGCIAVTDKEIEEIYAMVKDGTQINIFP
jgi:murein L,D-transpeptidase YafK